MYVCPRLTHFTEKVEGKKDDLVHLIRGLGFSFCNVFVITEYNSCLMH